MVKITYILLIILTTKSYAIFDQTRFDINVLEDDLKYRLETESGLKNKMLPMLVATPKHLWEESRADFSPLIIEMLKNTFTEKNLIMCSDCDSWRLKVNKNNSLLIDNGELSIGELSSLNKNPLYNKAKSLVVIKEITSGILMRIISVKDGKILYLKLANSLEKLDKTKVLLNLAQEKERRLRGESLAYLFANLGVYPNLLIQLEFVEQWGNRNQNISGIGFSFKSSGVHIGLIHHYFFKYNEHKFDLGLSLYLSLNKPGKIEPQAMFSYLTSPTYGVFVATDIKSYTVGFNFFNTLFLPFTL